MCLCLQSRKGCVLFIDIVEYKLQIESFLCKNIFSMPARKERVVKGLGCLTITGLE